MHLRPAFIEHDPARIRAHIQEHPFGLLATVGPRGIEASHIPFALRETGDGFVLHGHLAAGNAQCAAMEGGDALAVFGGPHAYISPAWYRVQPAVPTWDYAAVHVSGTLEPVSDPVEVEAGLQALAAYHPSGFRMDAMESKFKARMLAGIRAFRLVPRHVEAQWKMSQNRGVADRQSVIAALRAQGDAASVEVAALIEATLPT